MRGPVLHFSDLINKQLIQKEQLKSGDIPTCVMLLSHGSVALPRADKPAVSPHIWHTGIWTLPCCVTSPQRLWQLPSGFLNHGTDGEADKRCYLRSFPLLLTKYFSLATVSWPAVGSVVKHTHTHRSQSCVPPPSTQASWLLPSTCLQSRKNSHKLLCSRSGCQGWAATWTAGGDVSAVNVCFSLNRRLRRLPSLFCSASTFSSCSNRWR